MPVENGFGAMRRCQESVLWLPPAIRALNRIAVLSTVNAAIHPRKPPASFVPRKSSAMRYRSSAKTYLRRPSSQFRISSCFVRHQFFMASGSWRLHRGAGFKKILPAGAKPLPRWRHTMTQFQRYRSFRRLTVSNKTTQRLKCRQFQRFSHPSAGRSCQKLVTKRPTARYCPQLSPSHRAPRCPTTITCRKTPNGMQCRRRR